ncbi:DNA helicase [Tanacetum coccineum]
MRLSHGNIDGTDKEKIVVFAQWLLDIGDGCTGTSDDTNPENTSWVDIPPAYCILNDEHGVSNLISFIYDDDTLQHPTAEPSQQKAIVCPKNETADIINAKVLSMLPGNTRTYISFDEAIPHSHDGGEVELLYPTEWSLQWNTYDRNPTTTQGPWQPVMLRRLFQTGTDLPKGSARKALFREEEKDESTKRLNKIPLTTHGMHTCTPA